MVAWRIERSSRGREGMGRAFRLGKPSDGRGKCGVCSVAEACGVWGKNQWEGHCLSCSVSASFSGEPWRSTEGFQTWETISSWASSVVEDEWMEEAIDEVPSGDWQEKRRPWMKGGVAWLETKAQGQKHFWDGRNKSKALKLSPSWDPVTCSILQAAALPRWPAAVGFGCVKLGVEEGLEGIQNGWAKDAGRLAYL